MFPLVDGGSTLGVSAVKINRSHIYLQCDPHSRIRPGLSCSLWLHCNVIESPTFFAVWGPWRECLFFFLPRIVSDKSNNIWLLALQPLSLALSLTHAGANTTVCLAGCGVYRVMIKGLGEWHPQALKPSDWKWLWKHAHLSTCVQILVYMLHVCKHGHSHSYQSTDCNPYRGFSVASQISWQPHGAPAVKRAVIDNSLISSKQEGEKKKIVVI